MSRDLRKYAHQTNVRLIIGAIIILFLVGDGLIYLIYGTTAALTGFLCLGGGLIPPLIVVLILGLMDWVVHRANRE
ncbi:MAG: hypothetical protein M1281_07315 [Chloroflexi bacterium]|nr:hypothetical protein [Chloroflexota bacterium]